MITTPNSLAAALALSVAGIMASPAALATTYKATIYNGAAMCAPAVPAGQPQISVRPYGINNNGPNSNYVSCSFPIEVISDIRTDSVNNTNGPFIRVYLWNSSTQYRQVNCTISGGTRAGTGNISAAISRSVLLSANSKDSFFIFDIDRRTAFGNVAVSCLLPPSVELNEVDIYEYDVDNQL